MSGSENSEEPKPSGFPGKLPPPASPRLTVSATVVGWVIFAMLLATGVLGYRVWQGERFFENRRRNLEEAWEEFEALSAMRDSLIRTRMLAHELDGSWKDGIACATLLKEVRDRAPASIRIVKVDVSTSYRFEARDDEEPGVPTRHLMMIVAGRAFGSSPEEDVLHYHETLKASLRLQGIVESVQLQGLQRGESVHDDQGAYTVFGFEIRSLPHPLERG